MIFAMIGYFIGSILSVAASECDRRASYNDYRTYRGPREKESTQALAWRSKHP